MEKSNNAVSAPIRFVGDSPTSALGRCLSYPISAFGEACFRWAARPGLSTRCVSEEFNFPIVWALTSSSVKCWVVKSCLRFPDGTEGSNSGNLACPVLGRVGGSSPNNVYCTIVPLRSAPRLPNPTPSVRLIFHTRPPPTAPPRVSLRNQPR